MGHPIPPLDGGASHTVRMEPPVAMHPAPIPDLLGTSPRVDRGARRAASLPSRERHPTAEGHRLRNSKCRLLREMKRIPMDNKLLLTGTPLLNNLAMLRSLLNFILLHIFSSHQFGPDWFLVLRTIFVRFCPCGKRLLREDAEASMFLMDHMALWLVSALLGYLQRHRPDRFLVSLEQICGVIAACFGRAAQKIWHHGCLFNNKFLDCEPLSVPEIESLPQPFAMILCFWLL
ncbi:unnamed protein product [Miscanthus lutarioriparius]|uniref:SNF2 N-terminal domain-containing protein n=1 Tax=Miscanthus lutarioriparius TaxID=422564 RepID=A0A811RKG3_9POAL|nr:unnamed protein product [Miscanthus lutarioriparius]